MQGKARKRNSGWGRGRLESSGQAQEPSGVRRGSGAAPEALPKLLGQASRDDLAVVLDGAERRQVLVLLQHGARAALVAHRLPVGAQLHALGEARGQLEEELQLPQQRVDPWGTRAGVFSPKAARAAHLSTCSGAGPTCQLGDALVAVLQRGADTRAEVRDHCHVSGQPVHLVLHLPEIVLHLPDGVWEGKGTGEGKGDEGCRGGSTRLATQPRCSHTRPLPKRA